jgi:hypothetical protein
VAGAPAAIAAGRSGHGARLNVACFKSPSSAREGPFPCLTAREPIRADSAESNSLKLESKLSSESGPATTLKHGHVTRIERPGCWLVRGIRRRCHRTIEWSVSSPTERNAHSPDKSPPRARTASRAASCPLQRACRFRYPGPMGQPRTRPAARLSSTSRSHPLFRPIVLLPLASHRMHETYRVAKFGVSRAQCKSLIL